jgi:hypothetical protein
MKLKSSAIFKKKAQSNFSRYVDITQNHTNMHFLGGIRMGNKINLIHKKEFLTLVENMPK